MGLINILFGRPLASSEDEGERITPTQGIPTFGLDALSSAAYGPEAALTILLPLGLVGVRYIVPLTFAIIGLLVIVYFSYRQTIAAYPNGGGSYTVAKENLGNGAGLLAGAALMIDYLLNVAVGISGGHPVAVVPPPEQAPAALQAVGLWLLLRAFASGCTALTGVEAVSNGVQAFRKPVVPAARATLTAIIAILIVP